MTECYFDNSATTRVSEAAAAEVMRVMTCDYGNPSSLHTKGFEAGRILEQSREIVANALAADKSEIYFTSGGTEGNNLAVLGGASAMKRRGKRVVTTSIEHPSVYDAVSQLEKEGFEVVRLKPDIYGNITSEQFDEAVNSDTVLVSVMLVNNEMGSVLPVQDICKIVKRKNSPALIHCDAVQAFGKMDIKAARLGADIITVSSHKIHGPKGAGAIYLKKGKRIIPRTFGGLQESSLRCGTEALPLIAGFAQAVGEFNAEDCRKVSELNLYVRERLLKVDNIIINSSDESSPYILNISVPGVRSETMLHSLSSKGIYVSSGSACSKGKKSRVLTECGLEFKNLDSALRISFSKYNTRTEADRLIEEIQESYRSLARGKA